MNAENKVSETLLQKPIEVKIGNTTYYVEKPKLSTLYLVSKDISELMLSDAINKDDIVPCILNMINNDAERQAKIIATFILGGKIIRKERFNPFKKSLQKLTEEVFDNVDCEQANRIISECLSFGSIGFFLQTTISLRGANLSEPTKTEATARGE